MRVMIDLPRYMTRRERRGGKVAHYFVVPARLRPSGWPATIRLPDDLVAAIDRAKTLGRGLDDARAGEARGPAPGTLPAIWADYQQSDKWAAIAQKTRRGYRQCWERIEPWSARAGHPKARTIGRPAVLKFLNGIQAPAMRAAVGRFLRVLLQHGYDIGEVETNPAAKLGLKRPKPKDFHVWEDDQIDAVLDAADALGHASVGDAFLIACEVGQRQGDILAMRYGQEYRDGVFHIVQSKTGRRVEVPATARLRARLAARGQHLGHLITMDRRGAGRPYGEDHFRHVFSQVREAAGLPKGAEFRHGRHRAVCLLSDMGFSALDISTITGHTPASVQNVLARHYWRPNSKRAAEIIAAVDRKREPGNG